MSDQQGDSGTKLINSLGMKGTIYASIFLFILGYIFIDFDSAPTVLPTATEQAEDPAVFQALLAGCIECHGDDGTVSVDGSPFIAGQNVDYLTFAMRTYVMGIREHEGMEKAILKVSLKDVRKLATHYANQRGRWQGGGVGLSKEARLAFPGEVPFDPLAEGELIATACNRCHLNEKEGVPRIRGLAFSYLVLAIKHYQEGRRTHAPMPALNTYDIERVSYYYASQKVEKTELTPVADSALVAGCYGCHGKRGNSKKRAIPSIAGQDAAYLASAMRAYQKGERSHGLENKGLSQLSEEEIDSIAHFYASQQLLPLRVRRMREPEELSQGCNGCHGYNGHSMNASRPMIAGQVESYLLDALEKFQTGERDNTAMFDMTRRLSQLEIRAIANFYATQ